jgi:hypothetical protein
VRAKRIGFETEAFFRIANVIRLFNGLVHSLSIIANMETTCGIFGKPRETEERVGQHWG